MRRNPAKKRGENYTFDPEAGVVFGLLGEPIGYPSGAGYILISRHGRAVGTAHRMIWKHVHGDIPEGFEINHINGVKTDNRIANLELVTSRENKLHAYRTGLHVSLKGEQHPKAKLTENDVREIRASPESALALGRRLGVSGRSVTAVRNGETWKHVK